MLSTPHRQATSPAISNGLRRRYHSTQARVAWDTHLLMAACTNSTVISSSNRSQRPLASARGKTPHRLIKHSKQFPAQARPSRPIRGMYRPASPTECLRQLLKLRQRRRRTTLCSSRGGRVLGLAIICVTSPLKNASRATVRTSQWATITAVTAAEPQLQAD